MRSGFTLLETLIALVITSVVVVATLEMIAALSEHAVRVERALVSANASTLEALPLRRAIENAIPGYADEPLHFEGDERRFSSITQAGVLAEPGRPTPFSAALEASEAGEALVYSEAGEPVLRRELGRGPHRFVFVDRRGERHAQWPPEERRRDDPTFYILSPVLILVIDESLDDDSASDDKGAGGVVAAYAPREDRRPPLRTQDMADLI